ncbi:MAG: serine hydroxymethyltransferase [Legionellales bacterium RIFCSPHIGHO2_12_FULL_42_9]|nr:MAG: serine hydroxymethyltransferase [Legionellales bacterium RIFCSPHIGHO2_12_FULL_42_9]
MFSNQETIAIFDNQLWQAMQCELQRQEEHVELIASENYVSKRVLEAQGSILTNKYAEGYPGKRYYGGCQFVDEVELLAIERAKKIFKADFANVQPHSGSQANAAAMAALLSPGDRILGLALSHGGHLTHGSKVNFSGKLYQSAEYLLDADTGLIDYDKLEDLAVIFKPKMIIAGFSAYSQILDWPRFRSIADRVGAYLLADVAHVAGLIAVDLYPTPIPYADCVTTTTHKTLRGPRGGMIIARANPEIEKKLNSAIFPGTQGGPFMHIIAAKAVALAEAMRPEFKQYQQQVLNNATHLAQALLKRGYPIISNGTKNHLMLVSLVEKNITGKQADALLGQANITVNKNTIPNDPQSPFITSGLRLGTPAVTTRGFKEPEIALIAEWIANLLDTPNDNDLVLQIRENVIQLCHKFPIYG